MPFIFIKEEMVLPSEKSKSLAKYVKKQLISDGIFFFLKPLSDGIIKSSTSLKPRLAGFGTQPSLLSQKKTRSVSFGQYFLSTHIYSSKQGAHGYVILSQKRRGLVLPFWLGFQKKYWHRITEYYWILSCLILSKSHPNWFGGV